MTTIEELRWNLVQERVMRLRLGILEIVQRLNLEQMTDDVAAPELYEQLLRNLLVADDELERLAGAVLRQQ
jgi:hypothetical protein